MISILFFGENIRKERDVVKISSLYEIDFPEKVMLSLGANPGDNILFVEEEGKIYLKKE